MSLDELLSMLWECFSIVFAYLFVLVVGVGGFVLGVWAVVMFSVWLFSMVP